MAFELPSLPYSKTALAAKGMCEETLDLHHGKHHQAYVTALNGFVEKDSNLPSGYSVEVAGDSAQQAQSFGQLFTALAASVLLAYLLMAVLFDNLIHPFTIQLSLPMAMISAIAFAGFRPFGQVFVQFMMVWQR